MMLFRKKEHVKQDLLCLPPKKCCRWSRYTALECIMPEFTLRRPVYAAGGPEPVYRAGGGHEEIPLSPLQFRHQPARQGQQRF